MKLVGPIPISLITLAAALVLGGCGTPSPGSPAETTGNSRSAIASSDAAVKLVGPCSNSAGATAPGTHIVALLDLSADSTLTYSMTHHVNLPGTQGALEPCGDRMTVRVSEHVAITAEHGTICQSGPTGTASCTLDLMKATAARWGQITPIAQIVIDTDHVVRIDEVYNG
ncbi:hypothetical protein [Nocardia sp. NPDC056000]|uniref:hypothetical protein n=1 Tax=Nocardia sp. NPDC056000 TaxID=3345674 RepID=UPI0035E1F212